MNRSKTITRRLPAEWEQQQAIMITWPNKKSNWSEVYDQVLQWYLSFTLLLAQEMKVIVATSDLTYTQDRIRTAVQSEIPRSDQKKILEQINLWQSPTNDTWTRDHGPITILEQEEPILLDYSFNAWGMKFPAHFDNQITRSLHIQGAFGSLEHRRMTPVIEGGAIDTNGQGELMVTQSSIIDDNRNPLWTRESWEHHWNEHWGIQKVHWIEHGAITGDDTDGHIDTLARFSDSQTIVYQSCDDPQDQDYKELTNMKGELESLKNLQGRSFTLVPLPWPKAKYAPDGHRVPATYANFLITNKSVWLPTYNDPMDKEAIRVLEHQFPERTVRPIDCQVLILQHGSLHCSTMNIVAQTSPENQRISL